MKIRLPLSIKTIGSLITGYTTYITIKSYYENNIKDEIIKNYMEKTKRTNDNLEYIKEIAFRSEGKLHKIDSEINNSSEVEEYVRVKGEVEKLVEAYEQNKSETNYNEVMSKLTDMNSALDKLSGKFNKIKEILNENSNNSLLSFDNITNFIKDYEEFLLQLNQTQKFSLIHILISIFILLSLISLIGVFLGDKIINYLNLELRYPRLARFFQIRRKFQMYYFIFDSILIIIALLILIVINLLNLYY